MSSRTPSPKTPYLYPIPLPYVGTPAPVVPQLHPAALPEVHTNPILPPSQLTLHPLLDADKYHDDEDKPLSWPILPRIDDVVRSSVLKEAATEPPTGSMVIYVPFGELVFSVTPSKGSPHVTVGDVLRAICIKVTESVDPNNLSADEMNAARSSRNERLHSADHRHTIGVLSEHATVWDVLNGMGSVQFAGLSYHEEKWLLQTTS